MKYIFATDEDLDIAGIRQAGNTDRKTFRGKNVDWKVGQRGKCEGPESFELMGETI